MRTNNIYFHSEEIHNLRSPNVILPIIFKLFHPKSIIDIGCGIGTWLSVAQKLGAVEVLGVDGDFVNRELLDKYLKSDFFIPADLNKPFDFSRKFDIAICLEVAEHLPESSANGLIESLVKHADIILFSAAIPGQGGQNHLNEQWPEFWINKFKLQNFNFYDIVRPIIWDNDDVEFWYRQNIFLFSNKKIETFDFLDFHGFPLIHPKLFEKSSLEIISLIKENKVLIGKSISIFSLLKKFFKKLIGFIK